VLGGELGAQRLGGGVRLGGTQTMWDQGAVTQTGNPLDLAIRGGGLFAVKGNQGGKTDQYYTRDGRFHLDDRGYVVNPGGLRLQGFAIDSAGARALSAGDLPLGARESPPVATTSAAMTLNLDANATVPAAWDPLNPGTTSNYATSATVYDSLGAAHHVEVYFRSQGSGAWEYHAMVDGGELTGGTKGTLTEIGTGNLTFNTAGALVSQTSTSSASFVNAAPGQVVQFTFGDDTASGGTGLAGTTQFSGASSVNGLDINGRSAGKLTEVEVGDDGKIRGIFDNGDKIELAQVALADFANEDGLERTGDGLMLETATSGNALIDVPGTGARGALSSGALESSNVDLGNELVTLIAYQRAFQANAKTVTTADEMLQDVNSLKR
jgi:flagellar hook protein FlgE